MLRAIVTAALLVAFATPIPVPKPRPSLGHTDQWQNEASGKPQTNPPDEHHSPAHPDPSYPVGESERAPLYIEAHCPHGCGYSEQDSWVQKFWTDPNATFALAVAFFTLGLVGTGIWTNLLVLAQIKLTRDEFNASHRPEIIVHAIEFATDKNGDNETMGAHVTFFNKGRTVAKNVIIAADIRAIDGRPLPGLVHTALPRAPVDMIPGRRAEFAVTSTVPVIAFKLTIRLDREHGEDPPTPYYCIGEIRYFDGNGAERVTGFNWRLHGGQRWVRQSRSAYEYAY